MDAQRRPLSPRRRRLLLVRRPRSDDLFNVKGLWVSPIEVEEAPPSYAGVLEGAVVPSLTHDGLNVVMRSKPLTENEAARLKREMIAVFPNTNFPPRSIS